MQRIRLRFLLIITLMMILLSACKPTPVATPLASTTASRTLVIATDIIGMQQWKPSSSGSLVCVVSPDLDKDALKYTWSANGGHIEGYGNQVVWNTPNAIGDYVITVHVTDSKGNEAIINRTLNVVTNPYGNDTPDTTIYLKLSIPSAAKVHESRRLRIWTTSEIQCVVSGADSGLKYEWSAPIGKLNGIGLADGMASRVGWIAPGVASTYTVSVRVTDSSGNEATGDVAFEVLCCRNP